MMSVDLHPTLDQAKHEVRSYVQLILDSNTLELFDEVLNEFCESELMNMVAAVAPKQVAKLILYKVFSKTNEQFASYLEQMEVKE